MLQQQQAQYKQQAVEQEQANTKEQSERELDAANKALDAYVNNPEADKNDWEYKNAVAKLEDDIYELETGLERNTPQVHKEGSGFFRTVVDPVTGDKKQEEIMSTFIINKDGVPVFYSEGGKVAAQELDAAKHEALKLHNSTTANATADALAWAKEKFAAENKVARAKVTNDRIANQQSADKASSTGKAAQHTLADKLADRNEKAYKEKAAAIERGFQAQLAGLDEDDSDYESDFEGIMTAQDAALRELEYNEALGEWSEPGDMPADRQPTHRPSLRQFNEERDNRDLMDKENPTEQELNEQVQYDSPMDPEFSDEQFAGTEPAGLYDPTGQPLPMDGGMYNGYA